MNADIVEILDYLEQAFAQQYFDESKKYFNVASIKVESLYQQMKVHNLPKAEFELLSKIRNCVPSPDSLRCLKLVVAEYKRHQIPNVVTGRVSGKNMNMSSPPRSEARNETFREVYVGDVSHTIHHDHVTHHAPSTCYDSPSSDGGSSDCGGGGGGGD